MMWRRAAAARISSLVTSMPGWRTALQAFCKRFFIRINVAGREENFLKMDEFIHLSVNQFGIRL
jgi:hypothetical protein